MADRARGWPIAREGVPFLAAAAIPTVVAWTLGWMVASVLFGTATLFIGWFFRNPLRRVPGGPNLIVSPGDGRVLAVVEEEEPRFLKERAARVSIFLSPLNVHINRTPCAGLVQTVAYTPGKFRMANRPEATLENEQTAVLFETEAGRRILCVQVAGYVARRIVCWLSEGEQVARGERYGLIRFGSRMDLYVPIGTALRVKTGDRVVGGESVIGVLS
ncbi:MAG TPA: phosphatidylserine decarboxylase family protein [Nitrospirales bacterium]|jgi:phosphatidylserine decarboxylase|nr:phosphatidylserine decarboxylase family protein [Nitrospirales bacterium]